MLFVTHRPSRRTVPITVVLMVVVVALLVVMALQPRGRAAGAQIEAELEPIGVLVPDDQLDPRLLLMDLEGADYRRSVDQLETALFDRESTRRDLEQVTETVSDLAAQVRRLGGEISEGREAYSTAVAELDRLELQLAVRAVERFVHHGADLEEALDPTASIEAGREALLSAEVDDAQLRTRSDLIDMIASTEADLGMLQTELFHTEVALATTTDRRSLLEVAMGVANESVTAATTRVGSARRSARVPGIGLSVIAMDAYLDAETALSAADPGCGLRWWMVAGVARIESRHGEIGGRHLRADGRVDRPIIGIALDGGPAVQLVADTDGGRLDQDPEYDRAVGPLQFIPETWGRLGRDGNDDGVIDPQNIYDAAQSAAAYLCRGGLDLTDGGALRSAYFGYNGSTEYVEDVTGHALRYAALELPATR